MSIFKGILLSAIAVSLSAGIAQAEGPPANVGEAANAAMAYHDSGRYVADFKAVVNRAAAHLEDHKKNHWRDGERYAVVLDVDETVLSNWPVMSKLGLGFNAEIWNAWVAEGRAAALPGMVKFVDGVRKRGYRVVFLTARAASERIATKENLEAMGFVWDDLVLRPSYGPKQTSQAYKQRMRCLIQDKGYRIVMNIGDQLSDISGDCIGLKTFKLPNPFYFIP